MALSNIFREPRREITESVVGIAAIGLALAPSYWVAGWLSQMDQTIPMPVAILFGFILVGMAYLVVAIFLAITHGVGDAICDTLDRRGIRLRPRQRY